MLYELAKKEHARLFKLIQALKMELAKYPPGEFRAKKNGKYVSWFIYYEDRDKEYIKSKDIKKAKEMAKKKYFQIRLDNAEHELKAIEYYLRHHDENALEKEIDYLNNERYKQLLPPTLIPSNKYLEKWMNEPYEKNYSFKEHLIHDTLAGHKVRSKSEALIVSYLVNYNIPYRYECKLCINGVYLYPDFTIRHPQTGEIYYWEHFGMLDKPEYMEKFITSIRLYISAGILPGKNLIITTETSKIPLTYADVQRMIEEYFVA